MYWSIIIAALTTLAILLGGPPSTDMLTAGHPAPIAYVTVLGAGLVIALVLRSLHAGGWRSLRHLAVWAVVAGIAGAGFASRDALGFFYDRLRGELVPSLAVSTTSGEVELRRAWDGHYRADVEINGMTTRLLIDTGASMVLIPYEDAAKLGFDPATLEFSMPVTTANGRSAVAPVRIERLDVGVISVRNVTAAVSKPGTLTMGLLGMSFLDHLDETSFQRDKLFLRRHGLATADIPQGSASGGAGTEDISVHSTD